MAFETKSNLFTGKPEPMPEKWVVRPYGSIAATARVVDTPRAFDDYWSSEKDRGPDWAPLSFADTVSMARAGGYSREDARAMGAPVDASMLPTYMRPVMRRQVRNAPTGRHVSIPRAMAGDLAPMHTIRKGSRVNRTLRIGMDLACSFSTPAEVMTLRGRALMAVIDALETAGVSVEFTGLCCPGSRDGKHGLYMPVKLKAANTRLDPGTFAFAVVNPSFFRRIMFRALENEPTCATVLDANYGRGKPQYVAGYFDLCLPYYIHGLSYTPQITDEASAVDYVVAALESTDVGQAWKRGELH